MTFEAFGVFGNFGTCRTAFKHGCLSDLPPLVGYQQLTRMMWNERVWWARYNTVPFFNVNADTETSFQGIILPQSIPYAAEEKTRRSVVGVFCSLSFAIIRINKKRIKALDSQMREHIPALYWHHHPETNDLVPAPFTHFKGLLVLSGDSKQRAKYADFLRLGQFFMWWLIRLGYPTGDLRVALKDQDNETGHVSCTVRSFQHGARMPKMHCEYLSLSPASTIFHKQVHNLSCKSCVLPNMPQF